MGSGLDVDAPGQPGWRSRASRSGSTTDRVAAGCVSTPDGSIACTGSWNCTHNARSLLVTKETPHADGRRDLASASVETGKTILGEDRVPPLDEINSDSQFEGVEITEQEFEADWAKAKEWFDLP